MTLSFKNILMFVIVLGGVFGAGFLCGRSNNPMALPDSNYSEQKYLLNDDRVITLLDEQRDLMRDILRDELGACINGLKSLSMSEQLIPDNRKPDIKKEFLTSKKAQDAYQSADHILEDVIANGGFDADTASSFMERLNMLPIDMQVELRAKHLDAFNKGLINSSMTPEEAMMRGYVQPQK